jgi:beta-galactosidase
MIIYKSYKTILLFCALLLPGIAIYAQARKAPAMPASKQAFPRIAFDSVSYTVNGKPFYLYAGEFDYFRVPGKDWRTRMRLFKQAGGNCLATYIPWGLHEQEEGKFVFGGASKYDLEGFLKTAKEEGLYVIARPGPYVYSELHNSGIPAWMFGKYPAARAANMEGKAFDVASYLHPVFLQKVKQWFDKVCPIIARYTVDKGGPIAFVQLDNECGGIQIWRLGMDYNAETMGFGKADGRYPLFLEKRYQSIEKLNTSYHTTYAGFKNVLPASTKGSADVFEQRKAKDYGEFYFSTTAEYFKTLADMIKSYGIHAPFVANSWNTNVDMNYYEAQHLLGKELLMGTDHYYNLGQDWADNNPDPQYAIRVFQSLESLRLLGVPPTVFEFPGGSAADWPPITAHDVDACLMMHLAFGMKGLNYYIFTGGPNPDNLGSTTDVYDYNASISAKGAVRPLFKTVAKMGMFLKDNNWLCRASRQYDCRVGFDYRMQRAGQYWSHKGDLKVTDPEVFNFFQKGMLNTLLCNSYSPVLTDLNSDNLFNDMATPLIVTSSSAMAADIQQRLVRFLKKGGKVLLCPVVPEYDDQFNKCTILKDFLGSPEISENHSGNQRISFKTVVNVTKNGSSFATTKLPAGAQVTGMDSTNNKVIAWQLKTEGNGNLNYLGFNWFYQMNEHGLMINEMLNNLHARKLVTCSNKNLFTSLRSDGHTTMLFIMNLYSAPMETTVKIDSKHYNSGLVKLEPMSVKTIRIP